MAVIETRKQILIVDREIAAVEPLCQMLTLQGFSVQAMADGTAAVARLSERPPHLVIVDWNVPGFTALDLIRQMRRLDGCGAIRIMIISARVGENDIVSGLNCGADDFIAKPFSVREVAARVAGLLRSRHRAPHPRSMTCDALMLDTATSRAVANGRPIDLRGIEFRLLQFFMANHGRTFTRTQLLARVWGGGKAVDERTVDVNVQRLRKALSKSGHAEYIQTIRSFGYRFSPPIPSRAP
ncbi:MAG: phosphate response regulator transcription factor PhoB [Steroidobacteraceae bacterium]